MLPILGFEKFLTVSYRLLIGSYWIFRIVSYGFLSSASYLYRFVSYGALSYAFVSYPIVSYRTGYSCRILLYCIYASTIHVNGISLFYVATPLAMFYCIALLRLLAYLFHIGSSPPLSIGATECCFASLPFRCCVLYRGVPYCIALIGPFAR